jgi:ankyrin repeat protein
MTAAQEGDVETLTELLNDGWSVDSRDKYGGTALHWAAGKGQVQTAELLLQHGAAPEARLYKGGGRGRTPLHYAARNGHLAVCKLLVERGGAAVDALTHDSTPPFDLAVWKGRIETAEWLLSMVDNLHHVNDYGCDASHWVAMSGDITTARWLVGKGVTVCVEIRRP